ncbi:MAG: hypothetical protein A2Y17_04770 [Clostridiales bacterium GWF2_38_85]|nr:MAG: hypothetical protein A2Y17_04770 [Clostridiales bacterium GWF2_38_85]HBL84399.1 hypothetical protein [Clostridiales bacterium]
MAGEVVNHISFGSGIITFQDDKHIKVIFNKDEIKERTFVYPEAFIKYLEYKDKALQKQVNEILHTIKQKQDEVTTLFEKEKAELLVVKIERVQALQESAKKPPVKSRKRIIKK